MKRSFYYRTRRSVSVLALLGLAALAPLAGAQPAPSRGSAVPVPEAQALPEGRKLVADLLSRQPEQNLTNTGSLVVRRGDTERSRRIIFSTIVEGSQWWTIYRAPSTNATEAVTLRIAHCPGQPNRYLLEKGQGATPQELAADQLSLPFAQSDYWIGDLGLEFFHWKTQKLLRREIRRGQSCHVLESVNAKPTPGGYSRIISWIDADSGGIVHADAYDAAGKLIKQFAPKEFRKVSGRWELEEMEIRNRQTGSRSRIQFDLQSP